MLHGNVRFPEMFSTKVYLLEYFGVCVCVECSIISQQMFYLQMSDVNIFESVLMATQHWAQRFRETRLWNETDPSLNPHLDNLGQFTCFPGVSVFSFVSGEHNTYPMKLLWGIYFLKPYM